MPIKDWNRMAVQNLLADAELAVELTRLEDVRGNREIVEHTTARARKSYDNFVRRGSPLIMSDEERNAFEESLDRLRAALRVLGESAPHDPVDSKENRHQELT